MIVSNLKENKFVRGVAVLLSGSILGHAIMAVTMPIVTRLYEPSDFSTSSAFSSLSAILISISCLRFEIAIPLARNSSDAFKILLLSLTSTLIFSACVSLIIFVFGKGIFSYIGLTALEGYAFLVPIAIFTGGAFLALQMWYIRECSFSKLAHIRVSQSACAATSQVTLGFLGVGSIGLITAQLINYGAASFFLIPGLLRRELASGRPNFFKLKNTFLRYSNYPRYSIIESAANMASIHVPILIISATASQPEAGFLALSMLFLQIPMTLIGNAVSQVFISKAKNAYEFGYLSKLTKNTLLGLLKTGILPIIFIAIFAPFTFSVLFGSEWERSGILVTWMAPWFFMQILASPISSALHICGQQRLAMLLQVSGTILRVGAVLIANEYWPEWSTEGYAISGFIFYSFYLFIICKVVFFKK